jgi:hypothetical protein
MEAPAMKHELIKRQSVKDDARGRWERVLPDLAPALKEAVERRGSMSLVRSMVVAMAFGFFLTSIKPAVASATPAAFLPTACLC